MRRPRRSQAHISAPSNGAPPPESDFTDIEDIKTLVKPAQAATIKPTASRYTNSDSELSELSNEDADAPTVAERPSGLEVDEGEGETDSDEDTCEYSAYHGSDSEVSVSMNRGKKQPRNFKKRSKIILRNTETGHHEPAQSETEDDDLDIPNVTTASGRAQVRALIDSHQMRVDTRMKEVERARQALRAEEKQYRSLKRRLDRLQSSIAPLHRLPYELIGEIAFLCVQAGDSPWGLLRVCRSWRSACLNTPKLWGGLRIMLSRKWVLSSRYHDGKENCLTIDRLHQALARSGATPLHLEFRSFKGAGRRPRRKGANYEETIGQLLDIISSPKHISRLKSLSLDCDRRWLSYPIPDSFICGPFPALEHISLARSSSIMWPTVHINVANWAPRLSSAEFRGLWLAEVKPKWIEQLRELKIDGLRYGWASSGYHAVLAKCRSLTSLSLTNVQTYTYSGLNIELLSLVNLEIRHSVVRGRTFVTPALETLVIEKTEWRSSEIKGDPDIPHLREFHWAGFQKDWMLCHVSSPTVESLFIDMWNGGGWRLLWAWRDDTGFGEVHCVPQKLFVKHSGDAVPRDNVLENGRFLRIFRSVKEIKVMGIPIGRGVLKELAKTISPEESGASVFHDGAPRKGGKQPPMCPHAEVLELDMTHVGKKERRGMRALVSAVLKARQLRSMRCLWDEDEEWEEFCGTSMDTND